MRLLLHTILRRFFTQGQLSVRWPDELRTEYGDATGPAVNVWLKDWRTVRRIVFDPALATGEAYVDGTLVPVDCTIHDVLELVLRNLAINRIGHPVIRARERLAIAGRRFAPGNSARRSRRNVAHHYDLNGELYRLFLDEDRQYSCAYFQTGQETLEEAQAAKQRLIAAKLCLRPGMSVLDIGSGWGGLALTLARDFGVTVTGLTLSTEQLAASRQRALAEGLGDRVSFELLDYRAVSRRYDRIVSVGMFEHVGLKNYGAFFSAVSRCLAPDGIVLLHAIGRGRGPGRTDPWIEKYIFPGGYCPALSEVTPVIEKSELLITDIEILRLHYAMTLQHWRRRFDANAETIVALYDERFRRMFEYYLSGAELAFRAAGFMVFQIQLAHRPDAVPITRDYIAAARR
jgi:cyclopropane-fatty-acyl-phospholipid synthase